MRTERLSQYPPRRPGRERADAAHAAAPAQYHDEHCRRELVTPGASRITAPANLPHTWSRHRRHLGTVSKWRSFAPFFLAVAVAAAPPLTWLTDLDSAVKAAAEFARPLFVIVVPADAFDALRTDFQSSSAFTAAASECVLVRINPSDAAFRKTFPSVAPKSLAVIALPDAVPQFTYAEMPSLDALANDLTAVRARVRISAADKSAASGDDPAAIVALEKALALNPPFPEFEAARTRIAQASARGVAKVAAAQSLLAARKYVDAREALKKIVTDYAGTDAAIIASGRLSEISANPEIADSLKAAESEAAAKELFDRAGAAESKERFAEAAVLYKKIVEDYPKTSLASDAASNYDRIRRKAADEEKAAREKMDRDCRAWMAMGDSLAGAGKNEKAREYYTRIIDVYPNTGFAAMARDKLNKLK